MKTNFHKCLTKLRKARGYTQLQIADKLGISRSTYTNYELGQRSPDFEILERISDVLECSLDELFGRDSVQDASMLCEACTPYAANTWSGQSSGQSIADKKLAIGVQDYRSLRETGGYYVDKTQLIPEFLESGYQVTLITRPRRFGKSLNMSMLAEFLDCTKDSVNVFAGTKVSKSPALIEMNKHPVVFLSFLNTKGDTPDIMIQQLKNALEFEYRRYLTIMEDEKLPAKQREKLLNIYDCLNDLKVNKDNEGLIVNAVPVLCQALADYYEKKVFLLIDEYDTPFIAANAGGYYDEVRGLLAGVLSSSLKGNPSLNKAMLTGIQRVAKENIFSGLNNITVCTVLDEEYSDCFGFTEEETLELLQHYDLELTEEIKAMYDGYLFGKTGVYNPWSVTCYAARKKLDTFWVNTSENSIILNALEKSSDLFVTDYKRLIEDGSADVQVEMETSYYEQPDDASLWGLLVNAGMITVLEHTEDNYYTVRVPNYEVRKAFQNLTAFYLKIQEGHIAKMLICLKRERMEEFAEVYKKILLELPSYHDLKCENSYHMMMLGMCAFMYKDYEVKSNRESGMGRGDILLCAKNEKWPHMILEFKYTKDENESLDKLAREAVAQIKERKYDAGMSGGVCYIGLAHCGKNVEICWERR